MSKILKIAKFLSLLKKYQEWLLDGLCFDLTNDYGIYAILALISALQVEPLATFGSKSTAKAACIERSAKIFRLLVGDDP